MWGLQKEKKKEKKATTTSQELGQTGPVECIVGRHMGQTYIVWCHLGQKGP